LARRADNQRCVVELKLGRTYPEADLLQGCLYQLMLAQGDAAGAEASLAMVSFEPDRREQVFDAERLRHAQRALKQLLGELAGYPPLALEKSPPPEPTATSAASAIACVQVGVLEDIKRKLKAAFTEYGAPLNFSETAASGPAFIRYFATPQRGVLVRRVMGLSENIWMRMGTSKPPQISVHQGRVTVDVERPDRQCVLFSAWRSRMPRNVSGSARFAIGVGVDGDLVSADLSESQSPHLLVVGTTGSGKSEWLRAFLASLMATNTAATLGLALIDPKRLAFSSLERSSFLWKPVVYDEGAIELLDDLIDEMERRYTLLQQYSADDLSRYNERLGGGAKPLARIVCVCDEFADLLLRDRKTRKAIEERVARLGVKGRAAGVHLVFATQRAGREVLVGTIDSNLPARLALSVPRSADSRLVLGEAGAETLLGKGDLLYKDLGSPVRLQGLMVTRAELEELAAAKAA
jgi:DNA segregation ATPase FtsK/SpoIIIE-like protein